MTKSVKQSVMNGIKFMTKKKDIGQGDIYWVDLNPVIGTETNKVRPAVVVSGNLLNVASDRVMVVPITSNVRKIYPFEAEVNVNDIKGKVMADQMRAVDKRRCRGYICTLTKTEYHNVRSAIKVVLELE